MTPESPLPKAGRVIPRVVLPHRKSKEFTVYYGDTPTNNGSVRNPRHLFMLRQLTNTEPGTTLSTRDLANSSEGLYTHRKVAHMIRQLLQTLDLPADVLEPASEAVDGNLPSSFRLHAEVVFQGEPPTPRPSRQTKRRTTVRRTTEATPEAAPLRDFPTVLDLIGGPAALIPTAWDRERNRCAIKATNPEHNST